MGSGNRSVFMEEDQIIDWFRIGHYLTEKLAHGAGHIGYVIKKNIEETGILWRIKGNSSNS